MCAYTNIFFFLSHIWVSRVSKICTINSYHFSKVTVSLKMKEQSSTLALPEVAAPRLQILKWEKRGRDRPAFQKRIYESAWTNNTT